MTVPPALGALQLRLGWRAARLLVAARRPRPPARGADVRRTLVVLPSDAAGLPAAWALIKALGAPVVPVSTGNFVASVPDAFAGTVVRLGDPDWRGLPRRDVLARLWADLDVAISLEAPASLAAAVVVGAAPAGLRVGADAPGLEGVFDLAVAVEDLRPGAVPEAIRERLAQIRPPLVRWAPGAQLERWRG